VSLIQRATSARIVCGPHVANFISATSTGWFLVDGRQALGAGRSFALMGQYRAARVEGLARLILPQAPAHRCPVRVPTRAGFFCAPTSQNNEGHADLVAAARVQSSLAERGIRSGPRSAVLCAAVLAAIALYLVVSPCHPSLRIRLLAWQARNLRPPAERPSWAPCPRGAIAALQNP
jgi:hypothetical protein